MNTKNRPLFITTGDSNGVGLEVTTKALSKLPPRFYKQTPIVFIRKHPDFTSTQEKRIHEKHLKSLRRTFVFKTVEISGSPKLSSFDFSKNRIVEVLSDHEAPHWVEWAAENCLKKTSLGMVTGPLSKGLIASAGMKDIGHTDILKRVTKTKHVFMTFLGDDFNVALLTGHIPLEKVARAANSDLLSNLLHELKSSGLVKRKPAILLGLNPHAGDGGLIGREELDWMNAFVHENQKWLRGPLAADSAFSRKVWEKSSIYIALYHDQGLIPFKLHHGFKGCHFSLGLPVIRTSVDHGTAFDLFKKDCADPSSMLLALDWAARMAQTEMTKTTQS